MHDHLKLLSSSIKKGGDAEVIMDATGRHFRAIEKGTNHIAWLNQAIYLS